MWTKTGANLPALERGDGFGDVVDGFAGKGVAEVAEKDEKHGHFVEKRE